MQRQAPENSPCGSKYLAHLAGHQWLTPIILATWEAETRRVAIQGQPGQIVCKNLSPKQPEQNGLEVWLKW
jgi:hypothetical protein